MKPSQPNQTRVLLNREERLLLLRRLNLSATLRSQLELDSTRPVEAWLNVDEADDLREQVQDLLQTEGFDENYEPTPLGRVLESLVDKLFTG
jgi:hypothetical protein